MADMNIEKARHNMIEQQIRPWEVLDPQVLDLILRIPREEFVPAEYRAQAFTDMALPLGCGEVMMEPKVEARMLQSLAVQPGDKALEVGTGSGYVTALLAALSSEVVSVEIHPELLEAAQANLDAQGVNNITLEQGDAANGWDKAQPYDVIAVTGSMPTISRGLKENLQIGGRMFVVVGGDPIMEAVLVTRVNANEWREEFLFETLLAPLKGAEKKTPFKF